MKLDIKDQKILHTIEFDARMPISKVAKKVRLSKEVTNYRIKKLENNGIINSYRTLFNLYNLGKDYYAIFFKIKDYYQKEEEILAELKKIKRRSRIMISEGRWNLILTLRSTSIQQMIQETTPFLAKYGEIIEEKQISLTKEMYISKCYPIYPDIEKDAAEICHIKKDDKEIELGKLDVLISKKIAANPKYSLKILASEVNLDVKTIKKYIEKLKTNKLIIHYRTYINAEKLGFKRFLVMVSFKTLSKENQELINFLKSSRIVPILYTCFGMTDLIFEIIVSDITDLFNYLKELSMGYSSIIKETSFLPIIKYDRNSN
ncbi:MAG: Lrp/AsnC family transcriptional regulator [Nanoarchaeota archaeon]|nr:Lrp/AsnC family transcriptional regulator [Nanoarchaeota archaeon]MBU1632535.1 Lrp/AsnC family transcriptional regulator [Nanoarchaeota archaeon]MBU1875693.1 Lrp/AsnC family transcriptional regulator [Nanoarchaeota archaeon]